MIPYFQLYTYQYSVSKSPLTGDFHFDHQEDIDIVREVLWHACFLTLAPGLLGRPVVLRLATTSRYLLQDYALSKKAIINYLGTLISF